MKLIVQVNPLNAINIVFLSNYSGHKRENAKYGEHTIGTYLSFFNKINQ